MPMHRKNKCKGPRRGFDYNPNTGKYDIPRPKRDNEPWFWPSVRRRRVRNAMAKISRRKNRGN